MWYPTNHPPSFLPWDKISELLNNSSSEPYKKNHYCSAKTVCILKALFSACLSKINNTDFYSRFFHSFTAFVFLSKQLKYLHTWRIASSFDEKQLHKGLPFYQSDRASWIRNLRGSCNNLHLYWIKMQNIFTPSSRDIKPIILCIILLILANV